jgi:Tfp pilus assembly protein PilP
MRSAITLGLGIILAATAPGLLAQTKPATPAGAKPAPASAGATAQQPAKPAAKPAAPAPTKPAPQTAKPAAKPAAKSAAKPAAKAPMRPPVKPVKKVEKPSGSAAPAAAESEVRQARRDPFESLVNRQQNQAKAAPAIAGKPGLVIATLRLDGIVRAPNGMIAVVSNPQARTYFLREGDHLYDGTVEKISMDGVSFHEEGKDAFGKPMERQVNKRIYPSAGEQQ